MTSLDNSPPDYPTAGQLERTLSQKIQALYRDQLGHQPSKVTCQFFGTQLVIVLESSITPLEQRLNQAGQADLARQVRHQLSQIMKPLVGATVEAVSQVSVTEVLSDASLTTGRTGIIASLEDTPLVRNPEAIPKIKRSRLKLAEPNADLDLSS
ncbi:DUF2294 domain-containing protein [Romeria aff. gracilis LEGE 07310]|uniref:DUF2294 domain-containing protein n=2 Tax=Vasconcelosia TaxID=3366328 RepID=A0A8J7AWT7_9CYAN|nr:DUF2294 domain-containing protein [Romeria aff. gracilis LEGE 07310]